MKSKIKSAKQVFLLYPSYAVLRKIMFSLMNQNMNRMFHVYRMFETVKRVKLPVFKRKQNGPMKPICFVIR